MEQNNRKWIIRDASGRIEGPFTTEKILYKIGRGDFTGEEFVAHYPEGKWIAISQDPQFYDRLLEVLSDTRTDESSEDTNVFEFTRPQGEPLGETKGEATSTSSGDEIEVENTTSEVDDFVFSDRSKTRTRTRTGSGTKTTTAPGASSAKKDSRKKSIRSSKRRSSGLEDIELVDTRPQVWIETLRRIRIPIALLLLAGVAYFFLPSEEPLAEDRIQLLAPQRGVAQQAPGTIEARKKHGAADFVRDIYSSYLRAQNDFVYVVERNTNDAETMSLLCMTYLQLWPYTYQNAKDTRTIGTLVQMSSAVDPGGIYSATCRVVDLAVRARIQEAMSLVDSVLDARATGTPPIIFYYLKGMLYSWSNDNTSSIGYLQSSQQLWPQWILPYVVEAQAYAKLEKYGDAGNLYQRILKAVPDHTVARIELGILEYKHFNHYPQAEQHLSQALENGVAVRSVLARGYFGLAEIALKRGDQAASLKYAQKSFSMNSSFAPAKNLIVQLGGVEKLRGTKVKSIELVFEGDQFFREGDCHSAQALYKAAFEGDPKNATAALKAAQCLWQVSFSTEAIDWLNRAIKADPNLIEAYVTMADYQAQRFNFPAAARVLESARRVNPKSYEVYRGFANVELLRGNPAGALPYGKQALELYENDVETQILMSEANAALRDYKKAYNFAAKAVEIDINHRKAQIIYAQALAGLQGVDVGVDYLMKLVSNYSQVVEYRLALGKLLLADERYQQAEEIFRQIIRLEEKPKKAYIELAKALWADSNNPEALTLLLKAAALDPADSEPLYIAGSIYLDMKKPTEASVQFSRVLTINKLYPLVHYQLGRAALMLNDAREALLQTDQEKLANPNMADAYLLAAEAHAILGQYSNCADEYQKAMKLRPQEATIYIRIAQCYRKKGDLDAAVAMLNMAASKESGLAEIYKEQGAVFEVRGEVMRAIEAYQQYFVLSPDAPDRLAIEARISA